MMRMVTCAANDTLAEWVIDARQRTLDLIADLDDRQLIGPLLPTVNPMLWEIGHVAWFQEWWVLRHALGRAPILSDGDRLYDSAKVAHDTRWQLELHPRAAVLRYLEEVRDRVLDVLARPALTAAERYFILLALYHEDMHGEAFLYTRQTLAYPPPRFAMAAPPTLATAATVDRGGDLAVAGGTCLLGSRSDEPFVFDNEKWQHPVPVAPFRIARDAVTQGEFLEFVTAGGYTRREWWDDAGCRWLQGMGARHPVYWRSEGAEWHRRRFDQWVPLEPELPMLHVSHHEAEAYCRFAGRRLPTEVEWELAAGGAGEQKRPYPWGDAPADGRRAHLDGRTVGCVPASALEDGDSAAGCRQMIGNVWEWVQDDFLPYPGFAPDPYREYSEPWFATHKVLRGGSLATRARLIHNRWRNFYTPDRRDVWAGFRTCARDDA